MVIRFSTLYGHCPVDLLCHKHSCHLVGKRHLRQRYHEIRPSVDIAGKSVRTTDNEHQPPGQSVRLLRYQIRKLARTELTAAFVKQHNIIRRLDILKYRLSLCLFLLIASQRFRTLQIRYLYMLERYVMHNPGSVHFHKFSKLRARNFTYGKKGYFHFDF